MFSFLMLAKEPVMYSNGFDSKISHLTLESMRSLSLTSLIFCFESFCRASLRISFSSGT